MSSRRFDWASAGIVDAAEVRRQQGFGPFQETPATPADYLPRVVMTDPEKGPLTAYPGSGYCAPMTSSDLVTAHTCEECGEEFSTVHEATPEEHDCPGPGNLPEETATPDCREQDGRPCVFQPGHSFCLVCGEPDPPSQAQLQEQADRFRRRLEYGMLRCGRRVAV